MSKLAVGMRDAVQSWRRRLAPGNASDSGRSEIREGAVSLAAFFVVFTGWAALAPMDAAVVAPGVLVVAGNRQAVQHRDGGVVGRLAVIEGQRVQRDDILLELHAPEVLAQAQALVSQVADLQMQQARLLAEITSARSVQRPETWAAWPKDDQAIAEAVYVGHLRESGRDNGGWSEHGAKITGYRDEIIAVQKQEGLIADELAGLHQLAVKNLVPLTRLRATERALAALEGRRGELQALIATAKQDRSEEMRNAGARLAELTPKLAAARAQVEQTRVRAPKAGVVVALAVHTEGGVIRPGERLMDIVPEGRELIVEARVRPDDADDLKPGQSAQVRVTAFNGPDASMLTGKVRTVSADRFTDERTGQDYFVAEIIAPLAEVGPAREARLRAGLPVRVVIPTRKRTALQYLLEPLDQALWRSFREL